MKKIVTFFVLLVLIGMSFVNGQVNLQNGLLASYSFNSDGNDESGNGNNGTLYNSFEFVPGIINNALKINGCGYTNPCGGYMRLPFFDFNTMNQFSINFWVKYEGLSSSDGEPYFFYGDHTYGSLQVFRSGTSDSVYFTVGNQTGLTLYANDLNTWTMYSLVYNNMLVNVYKNGQFAGSFTDVVNVYGTNGALGSHWWWGGSTQSTRLSASFDELKIYNRALNFQEVQALYNESINLNNGLVAYYPFNGNANDESGNGNNGTVNGSTLTTDRFGNVDKAYSFDGVSNYIAINDNDIDDLQGDFTISQWINPNILSTSVIFNKHIPGLDDDGSWHIVLADDKIRFSNWGVGDFFSNGSIDINQWNNIVVSYNNSSNLFSLYINGILDLNVTSALNILNTNINVSIGSENNTQFFFNGILDDIRIYNRSLNTQEIDSLYHQGGWPLQAALTVQQRLDTTETPKHIFDSGIPLDSLYGKNYLGGKISYLIASAEAGLIAAPGDQAIVADWGCMGTAINGADGTVIGTGAQNTIDIVSGCLTVGTAAYIADTLTLNGYSDWFLPSKDELNALYLTKDIVGGFTWPYGYWSSSEFDANQAWGQCIANGGESKYDKYSGGVGSIRCIRSFGQFNTLSVSVNSTDVTCTSTKNGTATATVTDGTAPFIYHWSNGKTTPTISNLTAGIYSVTVTDANNNSVTAEATVGRIFVCETKVRSIDCGITANNLSKVIYCDASYGATNYEWEFTNSEGYSFTRLTGSSNTGFRLSWATGIEYGKTYNVRVRAYKNGMWSNFGTSCEISVAAIPLTQLKTLYCGASLNKFSQYIYCDAVVGAMDYEWEFTNTESNYLFNRTRGNASNSMLLSTITGLEYGKTYDVRVRAKIGTQWGSFGSVCTVTFVVPSTQVRADYCGITASNLNLTVYCDAVYGAINYEWEFTNSTTGNSITKQKGSSSTGIILSSVSGLQMNSTYNVKVRAKIAQVWGSFANACQISTPALPGTQLRADLCGTTLNSMSQYIFCDVVLNATDYEWEFVNYSIGSTTTKMRGLAINNLLVSSVTGLQLSNTYIVRVHAKVNGIWSNYGSTCLLSTPAGSVQKNGAENENSLFIGQNENGISNLEIVLSPNPIDKGNSFALTMQSDKKLKDCKINIYNIIGQIVYTKQLNIDANNYLLNIEQNEKFSSGLHIVQVEINGVVSRMKLIVE